MESVSLWLQPTKQPGNVSLVIQNATKAIKSELSNSKPPAEEPPSAPSEPEEPMSPSHMSTPPRDKPARKKATKPPKPPKPPKMPKAPKPPKVPKVKEGGKKKVKKVKEGGLPEKKPSSLAALESHAKDILSKMDQPKKVNVTHKISYILKNVKKRLLLIS